MSLNKNFKTVDVLCKTKVVVNIVLRWRQNVVERMWEINTRYTVLNVNCKQTSLTKLNTWVPMSSESLEEKSLFKNH